MPPPPHFRVTISGHLGPDAQRMEEWACNLSMSREEGTFLTRDSLVPLVPAIRGPLLTFFQATSTSQVRIDRVRVASLGNDGRVLRDTEGAYIQADSTDAPARCSGTNVVPFSVAWVMSLRSKNPSATGRGRFFVPCPNQPVDADGFVGLQPTTAKVAQLKTLLTSLNALGASIPGLGKVVIASGGSVTQGIPPRLYPVTSIDVGRVLDTMTSRRKGQDEARVRAVL